MKNLSNMTTRFHKFVFLPSEISISTECSVYLNVDLGSFFFKIKPEGDRIFKLTLMFSDLSDLLNIVNSMKVSLD